METIEAKAAASGLEKGYYLLLMAILEENDEQTEPATELATAS